MDRVVGEAFAIREKVAEIAPLQEVHHRGALHLPQERGNASSSSDNFGNHVVRNLMQRSRRVEYPESLVSNEERDEGYA